MNKIKLAFLVTLVFMGLACKRQDMILQIDGNAPAPGPVTDIHVENTFGGANLTYKLPADTNLLYVEAEYDIQPGITRKAKASLYQDTLMLDGFGDTLIHTVQLYAVGRNKKTSDGVTVSVHPRTPPVVSVFETLTLEATFSGAVVTFKNPSQAPLALVLMSDSTGLGDWAVATTDYTQASEGSFSVRGFDTLNTKFAVFVRDRWNNKSDTLLKTLKPLYEKKLDKSKFKEVDLPTDDYLGHSWGGISPRSMYFLWNDQWANGSDVFHTKTGDPRMPQWFTFDLGVRAKLSRFKLYHRDSGDGLYVGGDPEEYEIYGSNDPNPDGSWDNWTILGHFTSIKPSGPGPVTAEDTQFAGIDGEDFVFDASVPPVRYLRFKTLKTWGDFQYIFISELTFWGVEE